MNNPGAASNWKIWSVVVVFAAAMAWVEAAVVFYLRTHIDRIEPYQTNPLPIVGGFGFAELMREFATLVMLFTVGWLAGNTWRSRAGYMFIAFGAWDIFYYVFLKVMCGWPNSLFDWDILFLLPLPWWGPVLAPVLIATLMILWGTLAVVIEHNPVTQVSKERIWLLCLTGVGLALYVFMADALRVLSQGANAVREVLPVWFNWPLFIIALGLMSLPVISEIWHWQKRPETAAAKA